MADLSKDAGTVAGAMFGMMGKGSQLRFGLKHSRPSARLSVALAELVFHKIISHEVEPDGAHVYRPLVDCKPYFRKHGPAAIDGTDEGFPITERIGANG